MMKNNKICLAPLSRYLKSGSRVLMLMVAVCTSAFAQDVSQEKLDLLKRNIAKLDRWLDQANTEKSGLSQQLQKQEKAIAKVSKKIRTTNAQISQSVQKLSKLKKTEKTQSAKLEKQKTYLIQQLKAVYQQGKQPALKMLLDSDNPQETTRYLTYFAYINDARGEKIAAFKSAIEALNETKQQTLTQQKQLNQLKGKLEGNRKELVSSQRSRAATLAKLEASIKSESARLTKLKEDQKRLEQLLIEVEQAIANIPLPSDAAPFSRQKSKLPWPTRGKVMQRYGVKIAQGKLRANGIHIATKEDQAIQAVYSGRVVFSDWIRGFGLLIIVDHGEGFMSLYGNNKSLVKETGDWIRAKETIAYATDSSGKNESGLYFEIRRNGQPQNPLKWLKK